MTLLQVDPGGEKYLSFAKKKLADWKAQMLRAGTRTLDRVIQVSDGSMIYINSVMLADGIFRDNIRITGGSALVAADPFQPLWGIESALMPWTRAGVDPDLGYSATVQHVTAYYPNGDGAYLRRHWLVICRYCERVASYTWDETKAFVVPATYPATSTIVGAYVTHAADGSSVTLRDTDALGATSDRVVTISPSLTATSDANSYGWIETPGSAEPPHPGEEPATGDSLTVGPIYGINGPLIGYYSFGPQEVYEYSGLRADFSDGFSMTVTPSGNTSLGFGFGTWTAGTPSGTFNGLPVYTTQAPQVLTGGQVSALHAQFAVDVAAELAARRAPLDAAHEVWCQTALPRAKAVYEAVLAKMDAKKFTATDLNELRPYDSLTNHRLQRQALVVPAYSSAQITFTSCGADNTSALAFRSAALTPADLPASIYGVTAALSSPAVPPAPDTPWAVAVGAPVVYPYVPSTKTFGAASAATAALQPFKHAAFSKGVSPPLVLGQTQALGYVGFYRLQEPPAAVVLLSAAALADLMKRVCVGSITETELEFIVRHSVTLGAQASAARAYRAVEHAHVSGTYTFTQPPL